MAIDPCTEYGLTLALEDFVPVLLAGAGSVTLAQAAGKVLPSIRIPALLAGALITLGGFCKALWKTLVAAEPAATTRSSRTCSSPAWRSASPASPGR